MTKVCARAPHDLIGSLVVFCVLTATPAMANPVLVGTGQLSGSAVDQSGLTDMLSDGTPHNRLGGLGSAIAYTGSGEQYVTAPDRGPADGTTQYIDRVQTLTIHVDPNAGTVTPTLNTTTLLTNGSGQFFYRLLVRLRYEQSGK